MIIQPKVSIGGIWNIICICWVQKRIRQSVCKIWTQQLELSKYKRSCTFSQICIFSNFHQLHAVSYTMLLRPDAGFKAAFYEWWQADLCPLCSGANQTDWGESISMNHLKHANLALLLKRVKGRLKSWL